MVRYRALLNCEHGEGCSCGCSSHLEMGRKDVPEADRDALKKKFKHMMRALYRQEGAMMSVEVLRESEVLDFIDAHAAVLDSTFAKVKMSEGMRLSLQKSDWIFSGMKTFHELHEAFPSLLDENGERKPFERFYNDVWKVDETYNRNYLRAEYNFATASAEMAAKWEQYEREGDRYYLKYRTVGDSRVREEHAALNGTTLPVSHPFWDTHFPPNGWNCRCLAVQVRKSSHEQTSEQDLSRRTKALAEEQARDKRKSEMFRFNSGKQRKVFPDYNPYTIRGCNDCDLARGRNSLGFLPQNEVCESCRLLRSLNRQKNKAEYEKYLRDSKYKDVAYDEVSGGVKATHEEHTLDKNKGWYETTVQKVGYLNGHSVILGKEDHNQYKVTNIEGRWDGFTFEIAGAENATASNILRALKHCAKKEAEIAVLFFPNGNFVLEEFELGMKRFNGLRGKGKQHRVFNLIYCIQGEKIIQIIKPS